MSRLRKIWEDLVVGEFEENVTARPNHKISTHENVDSIEDLSNNLSIITNRDMCEDD